jgi:hypothetical protein
MSNSCVISGVGAGAANDSVDLNRRRTLEPINPSIPTDDTISSDVAEGDAKRNVRESRSSEYMKVGVGV